MYCLLQSSRGERSLEWCSLFLFELLLKSEIEGFERSLINNKTIDWILQEFERLLQQSRDCFAMLSKTQFRLNRLAIAAGDKGALQRSPYKMMLSKKSTKLRLNLRKRHYQLTFIFHQMIKIMLNSPYNNEVVFDSALVSRQMFVQERVIVVELTQLT